MGNETNKKKKKNWKKWKEKKIIFHNIVSRTSTRIPPRVVLRTREIYRSYFKIIKDPRTGVPIFRRDIRDYIPKRKLFHSFGRFSFSSLRRPVWVGFFFLFCYRFLIVSTPLFLLLMLSRKTVWIFETTSNLICTRVCVREKKFHNARVYDEIIYIFKSTTAAVVQKKKKNIKKTVKNMKRVRKVFPLRPKHNNNILQR